MNLLSCLCFMLATNSDPSRSLSFSYSLSLSLSSSDLEHFSCSQSGAAWHAEHEVRRGMRQLSSTGDRNLEAELGALFSARYRSLLLCVDFAVCCFCGECRLPFAIVPTSMLILCGINSVNKFQQNCVTIHRTGLWGECDVRFEWFEIC